MMRVLKILFVSNLNCMVQKLVEYLIDAGHFVYIYTTNETEKSEWKSKFKHNLNIIEQNNIPNQVFDYVLDFEDKITNIHYYKISFNVHLYHNSLVIFTLLKNNNNTAIIYKNSIKLENLSNVLEVNIEYFILQITELFIDSIIYFLRFSNDCLVFNNEISCDDSISELLDCTKLLTDLNNYYKLQKNKEDLFFIQNTSPSNNQSLDYAESKLKLSDQLNVINKNDLEIFTLYLMTLLNANNNAVYSYDLSFSDLSSNYASINKITKFIEINLLDSSEIILKKCSNNLYNIINNRFCYGSPSLKDSIKPEVLLSYDSKINNEGYIFSILYNSKKNELNIKYKKDLYFFEEIQMHFDNFLDKYKKFLIGKIKFKDLLALPSDYKKQILVEWNDTEKELYLNKKIHELFEEQVEQNPNKIALVYGSTKLTYKQLNEKANQLANYIVQMSIIKLNPLVVLCLDRNEYMLIAILAVLKAGGAYIPLDANYPDERIKCVLLDSNAHLVITNEVYKQRFEKINQESLLGTTITKKKPQIEVLEIDSEIIKNDLSQCLTTNLNSKINSLDIVYVIYTSGTTGNPKGVIIEHTSLVNIIISISKKIKFNNTDRILAVTTIAFDIAALEIFMPLTQGGELIITSQKDLVNTYKLVELIKSSKVTVLQATPSLWYLIAQILKGEKLDIQALCGGEPLTFSLALDIATIVNKCWNVYGPTETTVWSTIKEIDPKDKVLSIGSPVYNTKCYVLDYNLNPLSIGVIGELYIGGIGLARGYLNRSDLTDEKFISNPFQTSEEKKQKKHKKIYKTGDFVRWLPDGNLEYIGRKDLQIKIRGYRVEIGEIENKLSTYPGVDQCVVLTWEQKGRELDGSKYLVGYYVSSTKLNEEDILYYLKQLLPEYMVPALLVYIESLPLNFNNKVDRKALPEPKFISNNTFLAPSNELEVKLYNIWAEILNLPKDHANMHDNFFKLGGNSILAIRLISRINNEFQSDIKIRDVFYAQTFEKLFSLIENNIGKFTYKRFLMGNLDKKNLFEPFPLNNIQQAYYLGRMNNFELSNISTHVYSEYKYFNLDIENLENSFNQLLDRHLALRTVFENGYQRYLKEVPYYKIIIHELFSEADLINIRNQFSHKMYDPTKFPLFDIFITKINNYFILHISFDALIIDMSSFQILFDEWEKLYNNPALVLPGLQVSHRDYIFQYEKVRRSELFKEAERYWNAKLDNYNFEVNIPLKCNVSEINNPKFIRITKTIPHEIWNKLLNKTQEINISATSLVLAIYARIICYWSGQNKLCVNISLFNRLPIHSQINEIIGDFTILELFDYTDTQTKTIKEQLQEIHDSLWSDIEHSLFDGIDFLRLIRKERSIPNNQIVAPIVLTSMLGHNVLDLALDKSYKGVNYSISQTAQLWLDNKAYETKEGFVAEWDYVEQLFDKGIIEEIHSTYCEIIEQLSNMEWDKEFFPSLGSSQQEESSNEIFMDSFNEINSDTLLSRYERVVEDNHLLKDNAVIDICKGKEYKYEQLLYESNYLSKYILEIIEDGNNNSKLIGILCEISYHQLISTLSIMKAGCSYLHIDESWQQERLSKILKYNNIQIILISKIQSKNELIKEFLVNNYKVLIIEDILSKISNNEELRIYLDALSLPKVNSSYTACTVVNSTDEEKITIAYITHKEALDAIDTINNRFNITEKDKLLVNDSLSLYNLFGILVVGGSFLFIEQDKIKSPKMWLEAISKHHITIWCALPHFITLLIDQISNNQSNEINLRLYLLKGDLIPSSLAYKIRKISPNARVLAIRNVEGSITSLMYELDGLSASHNIARIIPNPIQNLYVLNHNNEKCPPGVVGEIYVSAKISHFQHSSNYSNTYADYIDHGKYGRLYKTCCLGKLNNTNYIGFVGAKNNIIDLNKNKINLELISSELLKLEGIKDVAIRVQKNNEKDYLIGYLIPKALSLHSGNEGLCTDEESFKLEQHGILTDVNFAYKLNPSLDCKKHLLRKSYRNFIKKEVDFEFVTNIGNKIVSNFEKEVAQLSKNDLNEENLTRVLSSISAIKLENRILPKYRYPSGGSSYSIRCFILLINNIENINKGYYYYNPVEYALSNVKQVIGNSQEQSHNELQLVVNWPSINPLYGNLSKKLVYLEVGHMVSLLIEELKQCDINYSLSILDRELDNANSLIATIQIGSPSVKLPSSNLKISYLKKEVNQQHYINLDNKKYFDLDKQSVFSRSAEFTPLLENGNMLIALEGEESINNFVLSGIYFQKISELLYEKNIGSCMLGFVPYDGSLYAMILGEVSEAEKEKASSIKERLPLQKIISRKLPNFIAEYMKPYDYVLLDQLPLNKDGLLEISGLPAYILNDQCTFVAPRNKFEAQACVIWSDILNIPANKIGIRGDFFRLGANSLLAMQMVRRFNSEFELNFRLNDLYKFRTIEDIFNNFIPDFDVVSRKEGVI